MAISKNKIAILGGGNIGASIAHGLFKSGAYKAKNIIITRRRKDLLQNFISEGFTATTDNKTAVSEAGKIIIAVTPQQLNDLIKEIKELINPEKHFVMSVVSGVSIKQLKKLLYEDLPVIRVMPNTAIAIQESMTCISGLEYEKEYRDEAIEIFDKLGKSVVIPEDLMVPATALCACGIAFFMRAIRAASQGGIEIGFHAEEALFMAAQTAKGAAAMLLNEDTHPEREVDKVTTPQGCTISGLNQMEHHGFSSSLIRGIITSAEKAETLYSNKD